MSMKSFHSRSQRPAPARPDVRPPPHRASGMLRADALLVARKLVESRTRARELIEAGLVSTETGTITKPGQLLSESGQLSVAEDECIRFVSRGTLKLAAALARCGVAASGKTCLDIGESAGGFTDCLLQAGAARVVGVDVGHGQLHPRLHSDERCVTLEGINARYLVAEDLGRHMPTTGFDLIVCDASFISFTLLMPRWPALLASGGDILALVKPQFELDREALGKGGGVRDPSAYAEVEGRIRAATDTADLVVLGWFDSPILGGGVGNTEGSREFLIWMKHRKHEQD